MHNLIPLALLALPLLVHFLPRLLQQIRVELAHLSKEPFRGIRHIPPEPRHLVCLVTHEVERRTQMRTRYEVLRNGNRRLHVYDEMPPPRRHVEDLSFAADALDTARGSPRLSVEGEEPLSDTQRRRHFTLVFGDVDTRRRGQFRRRREHNPVLGAADHRVPGAGCVGVFVETAS